MGSYEEAASGQDKPPLTDLEGDNPPEAWTAEQARQALGAAMEANQATMQRLHSQGLPIDTLTMLKMRLDFVTEFLLSKVSPQDHFNFAMNWEQRVASVLEGAEQAARMNRLALPPGVVLQDSNGNPPMPGQTQIPLS